MASQIVVQSDSMTNHTTKRTHTFIRRLGVSDQFLEDLSTKRLKTLYELVREGIFQRFSGMEDKTVCVENETLYSFFNDNHLEFQDLVAGFSKAQEYLEFNLYVYPTLDLLEDVVRKLYIRGSD